ncbi:T9SS type A sorting domain-containing protein, partial [bacterium]|nr:T9SS type A sorting domain-containing protein [bacterium]
TEFYLFDFLGREVYRTVINSSPYILEKSALPDGMYLWKAVGSSGIGVGKLILE